MSPGWITLFQTSTLVAAWAPALVLAGGPLLWRFLTYRPVTWRAILRAAWNFFAAGSWLFFGNGAIDAYRRELISLPMSIVAELVLFAVVVGGSYLVERRCPERRP